MPAAGRALRSNYPARELHLWTSKRRLAGASAAMAGDSWPASPGRLDRRSSVGVAGPVAGDSREVDSAGRERRSRDAVPIPDHRDPIGGARFVSLSGHLCEPAVRARNERLSLAADHLVQHRQFDPCSRRVNAARDSTSDSHRCRARPDSPNFGLREPARGCGRRHARFRPFADRQPCVTGVLG